MLSKYDNPIPHIYFLFFEKLTLVILQCLFLLEHKPI